MKKCGLFVMVLLILTALPGCMQNNQPDEVGIQETQKTPRASLAGETAGSGRLPIEELPAQYSREEAVRNGDYVDIHGNISNKNVMEDFMQKVSNKEDAFIRTVQFTVEGDPIITDFVYAGGKFTVTSDVTRDKFAAASSRKIFTEEYKNLIKYETENAIYYIITDLDSVAAENASNGYDGVILAYDRK